jgi:hypothetical protein
MMVAFRRLTLPSYDLGKLRRWRETSPHLVESNVMAVRLSNTVPVVLYRK